MWVMDRRGKIYASDAKSLQTDLGEVKLSGNPGDTIKSHRGEKFIVLGPEIPDMFKKMKRGPQTINMKDAGLIAAKIGLRSGYRVVDAGGGSGFLTCFMAKIAGNDGRIYSYENDKRSLSILRKNIEMLSLKNVEIIERDVYKGIQQKDIDAITLDLPEPWRVIKSAKKALKPGGFMAVYLPNMTQVQKFVEKNSMLLDSINEVILREWEVEKRVCRPKHRMLGHTGFIMFLRNV